ncbi:MAG TPA: hypothetical protein VFX19_01355, partial [Dehalococcoidia bacterium]|nr:hypothetical protein [Dehalococcoidia bacterium]
AVVGRLVIDPEDQHTGASDGQLVACNGLTSRGSLPTSRRYTTLAEAEVAFGFSVPDVHTPGWSFLGANEMDYGAIYAGAPNPPPPPQKSQFLGANITYICRDTTSVSLAIMPAGQIASFFDDYDLNQNRMTASIRGREVATVRTPDGLLIVLWQGDGRDYAAFSVERGSFNMADLLTVVEGLH